MTHLVFVLCGQHDVAVPHPRFNDLTMLSCSGFLAQIPWAHAAERIPPLLMLVASDVISHSERVCANEIKTNQTPHQYRGTVQVDTTLTRLHFRGG